MTVLSYESAPKANWTRAFFSEVVKIIDTLGAARECAFAFEEKRRPDAAALKALGINATAFDNVFKSR